MFVLVSISCIYRGTVLLDLVLVVRRSMLTTYVSYESSCTFGSCREVKSINYMCVVMRVHVMTYVALFGKSIFDLIVDS